MDEFYINKAHKLALKAYKKGEVPIGAVLVYKNKIIGTGYNQVEKKQDSSKHAEMIAIKKAQKKLKNWRLNDCILYVTLEPCIMCMGAIIQSRVKTIKYVLDSKYLSEKEKELLKNISSKNKIIKTKVNDYGKTEQLIKSFFSNRRKT